MKNKIWKSAVIGVGATALAAAFTLFGKVDVNAATAATNLTQTGSSDSHINVEWTGGLDDSRYSVQMSEDQKNWYEMKNTTWNSCGIDSGISAGKTYYLKVITTAKDGTTAESMPIDVVSAPSGKAGNLKWTDSTTSSVTLKWDAAKGANCYGLKYGNNNITDITEDLTYTINGLSNTFYGWVDVSAGRKSSNGYVAWSYGTVFCQAKTIPGKVTGIKKDNWHTYSKNNSSLWLQHNSVTNADGYQFKVYNTKNKCLGTYNSTSDKYIGIGDLSGRSCATVKARPYIKIGDKKKYGAWTSSKWIVPDVYGKYTTTSGKLKINWEKITGATGYDIYVKTDRNGVYKKVASVKGTKNTYVLKKFKGAKISTSKTYYVTVDAKKKVGNKTYKSSSN